MSVILMVRTAGAGTGRFESYKVRKLKHNRYWVGDGAVRGLKTLGLWDDPNKRSWALEAMAGKYTNKSGGNLK